MSQDNLQKLNNYFEKYIDGMIIKDIQLLEARNGELKFSYPYILLVCSCIDLFGGIEKGFTKPNGRRNSEKRFKWFITEWMGLVNPLYKESSLAYLIYDSWRCGIVHQATLKKGFETSSYMYPRDKHLHYIEDNERIFVHSLQFADDLIEAQKLYRKHINENATDTVYIDSLYNHLLNMIGENNVKTNRIYNQFIQFLQRNNLVFKSLSSTSMKSSTKSTSSTSSSSYSQENITRLPDELLPAVPSAAPEEDDLE
ncbi:hypothetical protein HYV21_01110 [Candidatus Microgenomates bacterium]|nr:hypothetical protein [Candidatus Microgenomates bacterium]